MFALRWQLHGLTLEGQTDDALLAERWRGAFASRPAVDTGPDLSCRLDVVADLPARPAGEPRFRQGAVIEYYLDGEHALAYFPRFGQLRLDLGRGASEGQIVRAALDTYGVLEDLIAIALSPHLRRHGQFLIHAFGAVAPSGRAILLVGQVGAGKTTTGLALLDAGWRLLSNDSPILRAPGGQPAEVLSYPGLLAAYPDSFARFPATAHLAQAEPASAGRRKVTVPAEAVWPGVWVERAGCAAIVFPRIEARAEHAVEPLAPPEALRRLLPHAVEQWDRDMLPAHLALLGGLVQAAPAYCLRLGPDVSTLPAVIGGLIT